MSRYDKVNLVPFGEFVPWPFGFVTRNHHRGGRFRARQASGGFADGRPQNRRVHLLRIGVPEFRPRFAADGAEVLFNISNDGWFGKSAARVAAPGDRAHAGGGEPALDSALDQ